MQKQQQQELVFLITKERVKRECNKEALELAKCMNEKRFPLIRCNPESRKLRECAFRRSEDEFKDKDREIILAYKERSKAGITGPGDVELREHLTQLLKKGGKDQRAPTC